MRIYEVENYEEMSKKASNIIVAQLMLNPKSVIGLPTGATPIGLYQMLRNKFELGEIDFKNVKTISLTEYKGINKDDINSNNYYMNDNLFNYVNTKNKNCFIPNGMAENEVDECDRYDKIIKENGPINILVLGLGNNGRIAFNEPSDEFIKNTHLVKLSQSTINDNQNNVLEYAYTIGTKTIMDAECVILLVNTIKKHDILNKALTGEITPKIPASVLQKHKNLIVIKVMKEE